MEFVNAKVVPLLDRFRDQRARVHLATWEEQDTFFIEHYDQENLHTLRLQIDGFGHLNIRPAKERGKTISASEMRVKLHAIYQDPHSWHGMGRWDVLWSGRPVESVQDRYGRLI